MSQYATLEEANAYFLTRLHSGVWAATNVSDRNVSLIQATRIIDRLNFSGDVTDSITPQPNEFPRGGDTDIPIDIKIASYEIAYALLDGADPEMETDNLSMVSEGYSSVRSTYNRQTALPHLASGIPSSVAWRHLLPYLRETNTFNMNRVS